MSRLTRTHIAAVVLMTLASFASCKKEANQPIEDPTGYFTFKGAVPNGFEEIDWIVINPKEPDKEIPHDSNWGSDFPHGLISFKNKKRVKFQTFAIHEGSLKFESSTIAGVSYKFEGQFGPRKAFDEMQKDFPALFGVLIKHSKEGEKRAEVEFYWFNGD